MTVGDYSTASLRTRQEGKKKGKEKEEVRYISVDCRSPGDGAAGWWIPSISLGTATGRQCMIVGMSDTCVMHKW